MPNLKSFADFSFSNIYFSIMKPNQCILELRFNVKIVFKIFIVLDARK